MLYDKKWDKVKDETIHPTALKELGHEASTIALGVAKDLRSGAIKPENYDQGSVCGAACCIAGHITARMWGFNHCDVPSIYKRSIGHPVGSRQWAWYQKCRDTSDGLSSLFGNYCSTPIKAADAIENYVLRGSTDPWNN